jgi:LPS-assembly protein
MKNKFIKILFIFILSLSSVESVFSEEFIFEVSEIEIEDNGNIYKGNNRGKITTSNQVEIVSNNFIYLKKINRLEASGSVQLIDFKNNIIINAEKIYYLKDDEKIYTVGKTLIKVEKDYTIEGEDLTLLKNKMVLSSKKKALITDNFANVYELNKFEYLINQEILKGEKIEVTTNYQKNDSDKYFFETGFINLKNSKFLAKDVGVKLHKTVFGDDKNDPRVIAVSGYGDKDNSYFDKGVFTSCKKTDKCPPWKITSDKIHHNKITKQIIYKSAWLEVYDFPVAYFPTFFHPDPTVIRQSGFLKPELGSSKNLGNSIYTPYFYVLSENKDITIKPRLFSNNKIVLQNEYRQKNKNSYTIIDFSIAKGHDSSPNDKNDTRSHFFTNTMLDLNFDNFLKSTVEINYEKSSNDNYLKLFNLESPLLLERSDVLESKIQLDLDADEFNFTTSVKMFETLDGPNSDRYSYTLPEYSLSKNFYTKNLKGSLNLKSSGNNTLNSTNINTSIINNNLNYTSFNHFLENGLKSNFIVSLKNINTVGKNSSQYDSSPQSELTSSYLFNTSFPLKKDTKKSLNTFEPKLSFRFSPHDMKNNKDINRRVDISNIYNVDRLGMGDSFESGESLTVGFDFKKEKVTYDEEIQKIEDYLEFKLATVFRVNEERDMPESSTLGGKNSNIFGELDYNPTKYLSLNYNFSIDEQLDSLEYNSLNAKLNFNNFSTRFNFLEQKGDMDTINFIENISTYAFNEENYLSFKTRRNKDLDLTEYYNLVYEYKNDCLVASIQYNKNYYNDGDIKPVEELFFTITIVPLTTFSPDKMVLK